jgi:proline dehydrogenase
MVLRPAVRHSMQSNFAKHFRRLKPLPPINDNGGGRVARSTQRTIAIVDKPRSMLQRTYITPGTDSHDVQSPKKTDRTVTDSHSSCPLPKTTPQLLRAMLIYKLCQFPWLVHNADLLFQWSRMLLGDNATLTLLKWTLFDQFCAGENEQHIQPVLAGLQASGIGAILDYAVETSVDHSSQHDNDTHSEAACDHHMESVCSCIRYLSNFAPVPTHQGFVALKMTTLVGNPDWLECMSCTIKKIETFCSTLDTHPDGMVSRDEFDREYCLHFSNDHERLPDVFNQLDLDGTGRIDSMMWTKLLTPRDLARLTANCQTAPLKQDLELLDSFFHRLDKIAKEAVQYDVKVLVDAEQIRFQPAIDHLVFQLQQKYNSTTTATSPVIYNTYQCYLKGAFQNIQKHLKHSERFSYHFGAKIVRGAYMESERALAECLNYPSPIHDNVDDTHECYNESVGYLLQQGVSNSAKNKTTAVEVMCATQNEESIDRVLELMDELGIANNSPSVRFAQLFGMSDQLTFHLGMRGYQVYKYIPYGKVFDVVPYLMRRAQENSSVLGNATREYGVVRDELWRRIMKDGFGH